MSSTAVEDPKGAAAAGQGDQADGSSKVDEGKYAASGDGTASGGGAAPDAGGAGTGEKDQSGDKVFLLAMNDAEPSVPKWKKYSAWKAVDLFGNGSIVPTEDNI